MTTATETGSSAALAGAIGKLKKASRGLPKKPAVVVIGPGAAGVAGAVEKLAGSLTVMGADRADFASPWSVEIPEADLIVAAGLLNGPAVENGAGRVAIAEPTAWLDRLRQACPLGRTGVWADVTAAPPSDVPLTLELDLPHDASRPPRSVAIDRFEALELHARVATEAEDAGGSILCVAAERLGAVSADGPLLTHVHVPKNGGMTVTGLLDASFGADHGHLYLEEPRDEQYPHRIRARLHERPGLRAISSHSFRRYPPTIGGRQMLYFTMLRDPADRYLSYLRYCQKHYDTLSEPHKAQLPEGFREMGVVEYIRWQAGRLEDGSGMSANLQCQYFAKPTNDRVAKQILARFFFVGVTEQMELSLRVLRAKAAMHGIELVDAPVSRQNTTDDLKEKTLREAEDPSVKAFLGKLGHDRELMKWARRRLEREAAMLGLNAD